MVYKLVLNGRNGWESIGAVASAFRLEYALNLVTEPKIGKIFVFTDLFMLRRFVENSLIKTNNPYLILKCESDPPEMALGMLDSRLTYSPTLLKIYWNEKKIPETGAVRGTYFVNWIKPIQVFEEFVH